MRCDLHVHSKYSGPADLPFLGRFARESYSEPAEIHETALRRGMDLVTITDHDSIDGAFELAGRPDFFIGEEVTCLLPASRQLHLGVFDITETHHLQIQCLRDDPEALFAYLAQEKIPFCVNHLFSPLTGAREVQDLHLALRNSPLIEAHNGMMPATTNESARSVGRAFGLGPVGGSDAHTLAPLGRSYTTVPRARNKKEFLDGLRLGLTVPSGQSGSYARLTADVIRIFLAALAENTASFPKGFAGAARAVVTLLAMPSLGLVPIITLAAFLREKRSASALYRRFQAASMPEAAAAPLEALGESLALGR